MSEDMDKAHGEGETRRKPLAELTDEELRGLAADAKHADEEVQAMVRQVYRAVLEERILMRYLLSKMTVRGRVWLLPALLDYVAREAELTDRLPRA